MSDKRWRPFGFQRRPSDKRLVPTSMGLTTEQRTHLEDRSKKEQRTIADLLREYLDEAIGRHLKEDAHAAVPHRP